VSDRTSLADGVDIVGCFGCFANVIRPIAVIDELFSVAQQRGIRLKLIQGSELNGRKSFLVVLREDIDRLPKDESGHYLPLLDGTGFSLFALQPDDLEAPVVVLRTV
jgi:hypothetical protein